jgi:hypothetical protein
MNVKDKLYIYLKIDLKKLNKYQLEELRVFLNKNKIIGEIEEGS